MYEHRIVVIINSTRSEMLVTSLNTSLNTSLWPPQFLDRSNALLGTARSRIDTDGLSNLEYTVVEKSRRALFTLVRVSITETWRGARQSPCSPTPPSRLIQPTGRLHFLLRLLPTSFLTSSSLTSSSSSSSLTSSSSSSSLTS